MSYTDAERYVTHYDGNGVEYVCLDWISVYMQIGDSRPLFFLNPGKMRIMKMIVRYSDQCGYDNECQW